MATLGQLLATLSPDSGIRGTEWERICKWVLLSAPEYAHEVARVWLREEWPGRSGTDIGIDLVAETKTGDLWAIQAKAYAPDHYVTKGDLDKFLSASSTSQYKNRILFATTDHLGPHAREVLAIQDEKPARFVGRSELDAVIGDGWPANPAELLPTRPTPHTPWPHQPAALDAVRAGFQTTDRGRLVMACGTGKTLVGLWLASELNAQRTLVLLPSLSLLAQTYREWCANDDPSSPFTPLFVCSDETVARGGTETDVAVASVRDLPLPATTDAATIRAFLCTPGRRVIFSTYQSSPKLEEAMRPATGEMPPPFDLVIADEAHRCVGRINTDFGTVLDEAKIAARRRLFMTATERVMTKQARKLHKDAGWETASMDDAASFGPRFYQLSFTKAIEDDLLTDYQVVVVVINNAMYREFVDRGRFVSVDGRDTDARSLAQQIALAKLMADPQYRLRRVVSFHSSIKGAERFADEFPKTVAALDVDDRPSGTIWAEVVTGKLTTAERIRRIGRLKSVGDEERGLLTNARCLTEGVDVPSLDGIAFIDPRSSQIDIVQAVGRAIRKSGGKTRGTIIIPIFIGEGDDPEVALSGSAFEPIWSVVRAIRVHDEAFAAELDALRQEFGKTSGLGKVKLPDNVRCVLPTERLPAQLELASFADALAHRLVEETTSSFDEGIGHLISYRAAGGHANIRQDYVVPGSAFPLGQWLHDRRKEKRRGTLSAERARAIEALGVYWDARDAAFDEGLREMTAFVAEHGHANVPKAYVVPGSGFWLGRWFSTRLHEQRHGTLSVERIQRLASVGVVWDRTGTGQEAPFDTRLDAGMRELTTFVAEHGHANVPTGYVVPVSGVRLGRWLEKRRRDKRRGVLPDERIQQFAALGVVWDPHAAAFDTGVRALTAFVAEHGHANVPKIYVVSGSGFPLGSWLCTRRYMQRRGTLSVEGTQQLAALGVVWDLYDTGFDAGLRELTAFFTEHGHTDMSQRYIVPGSRFRLGGWLNNRRVEKRRGTLSDNRVRALEGLGVIWEPRAARTR